MSQKEGIINSINNLLPVPEKVAFSKGELRIDKSFGIKLLGCVEPKLERAAKRLVERLLLRTKNKVDVYLVTALADAKLSITVAEKTPEIQNAVEDESYILEVTNSEISLNAPTIYGALRGIETFLQLLEIREVGFSISVVKIKDNPRFAWRGLLIDVSRHWIPAQIIKRNLAAMATVKLNVLHWHLTNDQGFRIESKKYPKLHGLGSDGLFYTQKEVREIVAFASDLGIRILPEFDIPAHTTSWFLGYPELASAPGPYQLQQHWGGSEPVINPASEATFVFTENLFTEMAALFPDNYVHIGGDQVNKKHWEENAEIRSFMKAEGFETIAEFHTYFNRRINEILAKLGKTMVGWDTILQDGLPKTSVIQSARGHKWLADAARKGYQCVAGSEYYLDLLLPASSHYNRDPYAEEVAKLNSAQKALILGGEASMWTEFADAENIELRIWPRAAAVAERLWSPENVTQTDEMYARLQKVADNLLSLGIDLESQYQRKLKNIGANRSTKALSVLAEIVSPKFDVRWNNKDYHTKTPLNRLVDAASPDSSLARIFNRKVDAFLVNPEDPELYNFLFAQLSIWENNHRALLQDSENAPLLKELKPISKTLEDISKIGIQNINLLQRQEKISSNLLKEQKLTLENAKRISAELFLLIVPTIQNLNNALKTDA